MLTTTNLVSQCKAAWISSPYCSKDMGLDTRCLELQITTAESREFCKDDLENAAYKKLQKID